jgi:hypothetical protein
MKLGSNFARGTAIPGATQDLALAVGERVLFSVPRLSSQSWINGTHSGVDAAHRFSQFTGGPVLQKITASARIQRTTEIARPRKRREYYDAWTGGGALEIVSQFEPGSLRHFDVRNYNIGLVLLGKFQRLAAVGGLGNHGDIGLEVKQSRKGAAQHGLVFSEQNTDRGG